jgi:hypothetical protein
MRFVGRDKESAEAQSALRNAEKRKSGGRRDAEIAFAEGLRPEGLSYRCG